MVTSARTKQTAATPAQVWSVLSNGRRYAEWVHGTKEIRDVDEGWPGEGASIHFTVGWGPFAHKDRTTSRACLPEKRLELEAHAWPAGTARIDLRVEPHQGGSLITMDEHPLRGPASWFHNPVAALGFKVRVSFMLNDLARLAEAEPTDAVAS